MKIIPKHTITVPLNISSIRKLLLLLEWLVLFFGVPLAVSLQWIPLKGFLSKLILLLVACLACLTYLMYDKTFNKRRLGGLTKVRFIWKSLTIRIVLCAILLLILCYLLAPEMLFAFVTRAPERWLVVLVCYPFLSAWPQELIYRTFIFQRYQKLFGDNLGIIAASSIAFAFLHVIYLNWIAITLTLIAGYLFSINYKKTSHLATVALEHAIYGDLLFTIGLGTFFYRSF